MDFQIVGRVINIETIAVDREVRQRRRLRRIYGKGTWRKMKGVAVVRVQDGRMYLAEIHWYEAHGIGRKEIKIKRALEEAD